MVFSGATLPAPYSCLKVGPLGPAGGAAERADLGCDAPGAAWGSTAGLDLWVHVTQNVPEEVGVARGTEVVRESHSQGLACPNPTMYT